MLLLVIGAIFALSACSIGRQAKISNSDIDKLNSANSSIRAIFTGCASATDLSACLTAAGPKLKTAATTYDDVAARAKGECSDALHAVATDLRGAPSGLQSLATQQKLIADIDAVATTCKLKRVKTS